MKSLVKMNVIRNLLTGTIPTEIGLVRHYTFAALHYSQFKKFLTEGKVDVRNSTLVVQFHVLGSIAFRDWAVDLAGESRILYVSILVLSLPGSIIDYII